jgi:hypothetical protein
MPGRSAAPRPPRSPAEEVLVLAQAHLQLQVDALVAPEQRQVAVRRGGADQLQAAGALEAAELAHEVAVEDLHQPSQAHEPVAPVASQRDEVAIADGVELGGRALRGREPLVEQMGQLRREVGMGELTGEDGRDAEGDGRRDAVVLQPPQLFEEGQVRIERGLAQPVAAVWPPAVMQHPRQMAVQHEDEIHDQCPARRPATARA